MRLVSERKVLGEVGVTQVKWYGENVSGVETGRFGEDCDTYQKYTTASDISQDQGGVFRV